MPRAEDDLGACKFFNSCEQLSARHDGFEPLGNGIAALWRGHATCTPAREVEADIEDSFETFEDSQEDDDDDDD